MIKFKKFIDIKVAVDLIEESLPYSVFNIKIKLSRNR